MVLIKERGGRLFKMKYRTLKILRSKKKRKKKNENN